MIKSMTEGNPLSLLIPFMVPLLIGNIFQQLYNISDIIIVGRLIGIDALAAVGAVSPLFMLTVFVTFGLSSGFSVITGQRFGAKDLEGVRRSIASSITLSIITIAIIILVFNCIIDTFLNILNVPPHLIADGTDYTMIIVNGLGAMMAYNLLSSVMRALGDSKTPLYALILSSIINIGLAIFFVGPMHWGVPGSAYAMVVAQLFSALVCILWIYYKSPELHIHLKDFTLNWGEMWEHLRMGLPMAAHFSVLGIGIVVMQSVTNSFGADTIAGFTAALRVEQLCTQPMVSAGLAMAVYTAQNFGAHRFDRIREGVKVMSFCSFCYGIGAALIIWYFGEQIVSLFLDHPNEEVLWAARNYIIYSVFCYFCLGQIFIYRNALQGIGLGLLPLCGALVELLARCGSALLLAPHIGYTAVCIAEPISWVSSSSLFAGCYYYFINVLEHGYKTGLRDED